MYFENDIFISYAHLDERPPLLGEKGGWISAFHTALEAFVCQYLGKKPKIWRDPKLQGNDEFGREIIEELEKAAVLVPVMSPPYVESEWCSKEIHKFYEIIKQKGSYLISNKARVFKVLKFPVPPERQLPKELQELLGYEFYQLDSASGKPHEIRPEFGSETKAEYLLKVSDLAYDIKKLLETLNLTLEKHHITYPQTTATKKTIYLAETAFDLNDERDKIKRELEQHGHKVLPDQLLTYNPDFQRVVCENLERCSLSIHLIGERYGIIPEGVDRSIVDLQIELAAIRCQEDSAFSRLIWMPKKLPEQEPRQEEFINSLQDSSELLQTTLEQLKTIIQDRLKSQQETPKELVTAQKGLVRVYLICDQRDLEVIEPLDDYLYKREFEVILPIFEGDEVQIRQHHQDSLQQCDAVMIYYGNGKEPWLQTKLRDLRGITGYGRSEPMLARAIYVGGPQTIQKQRFRTREALVIENFEAFSPDLLKPFLTQIAQGQGALR